MVLQKQAPTGLETRVHIPTGVETQFCAEVSVELLGYQWALCTSVLPMVPDRPA